MKKSINSFLEAISFTLKSFYSRLPNKYKYGNEYASYYDFLMVSNNWSMEKKIEYQCDKLNHVFKRSLLTEYYFNTDFDLSITNYPIVTKKESVDNFKKFIPSDVEHDTLILKKTGGSTGLPTKFFSSKSASIKELAFLDYIISLSGIEPSTIYRKVVFRGDLLPFRKKYFKLGNTLYLSSFNLSNADIKKFIFLINKFNPTLIHAFPSSIVTLAKFAINFDLKLNVPNLKLILTSSENFTLSDKKIVKSVFNSKLCDLYGNSEMNVLGYQYDFDEGVFPFQHSFVELGENNQIITTSLIEDDFIQIRYNTQDLVMPVDDNKFQLFSYSSVQGREQDFLIDVNRNKVYISSLNFHDSSFDGILSFQFYQNTLGHVEFRYVGEANLDALKDFFRSRLESFSMSYIKFDVLPRTKAGKLTMLVKENF